MPVGPKDLRQLASEEVRAAERIEAEIQRLKERAIEHRWKADGLQEAAERLEGRAKSLKRVPSRRTVRSMEHGDAPRENVSTGTFSRDVRRGLSRQRRQGVAQQRLRELGITITGLSALLSEKFGTKVTRERTSSWFASGTDARGKARFRGIPREFARFLAGEPYSIPETAWPLIQEPKSDE